MRWSDSLMVSVFFMISWIGKKETGDLPPIYWEKKTKRKRKNKYISLSARDCVCDCRF